MDKLLKGVEIHRIGQPNPLGVVYPVNEVLLELILSVEYFGTEPAVLGKEELEFEVARYSRLGNPSYRNP